MLCVLFGGKCNLSAFGEIYVFVKREIVCVYSEGKLRIARSLLAKMMTIVVRVQGDRILLTLTSVAISAKSVSITVTYVSFINADWVRIECVE